MKKRSPVKKPGNHATSEALTERLAQPLRRMIGLYGHDLQDVLQFIVTSWLHEHGHAAAVRLGNPIFDYAEKP